MVWYFYVCTDRNRRSMVGMVHTIEYLPYIIHKKPLDSDVLWDGPFTVIHYISLVFTFSHWSLLCVHISISLERLDYYCN